MRANRRLGFSLMEMMIVLLIVAIIAAASAPLVTKKLTRNGTNDSPWVFTGLGNSIAYNLNGNENNTAIIGTGTIPNEKHTRLFIHTNDENTASITFSQGDDNLLDLIANPEKGRIGISDAIITDDTVAFGVEQVVYDNTKGGTMIGRGSQIAGETPVAIGANTIAFSNSIAIGGTTEILYRYRIRVKYKLILFEREKVVFIIAKDQATAIANARNSIHGHVLSTTVEKEEKIYGTTATGKYSIAIGNYATATSLDSIAIGANSTTSEQRAIAIGKNANASANATISIGEWASASVSGGIAQGSRSSAEGQDSIAIGVDAKALHNRSVAIGKEAQTTAANQIVLGTADDTVYIPGKLVVGGNTFLGSRQEGDKSLVFIYHKTYGRNNWYVKNIEVNKQSNDDFRWGNYSWTSYFSSSIYSDKMLKNVGEKYTAGLEELKKLDFFHYTFKKDENKTPRVGVMAQDLQKVFPDAVVKGEDGYLLIRTEDMFYAVINAVKELDSKISALVEKVDSIVEDITTMKATIEAQQKTIDELKAQNEEIIKTNEKIMKRLEKLEKKKLSKVEE